MDAYFNSKTAAAAAAGGGGGGAEVVAETMVAVETVAVTAN